MTWLTTLRERTAAVPPHVLDAGLALLCYVLMAISAGAHNQTQPLTLLLIAVATLPLVWRRRWPLPVIAVCGTGTVTLTLLDRLGDLPYSQLVATYTLAAISGPLARLAGVAGTVVGVGLSFIGHQEKLVQLPIVGLLFIGAYALGTGTRARHDRIALLEERNRRHAEEREAAAARERERIARDMHDILAHSISLIAVQAEAGPVLVRSDPARAERVFDTIGQTSRETLTQLRRTLGLLRGETGSRAPQPDLDSLAALAERAREAGLAVAVEERGDRRPLPPELGLTAYRVVQESLTNVVRHARAKRVWIRLDWASDQLGVEVRDDGRGPSGANGDGGGHGIMGMHERVGAVGGELRTGPGPGGTGFQVVATLPLSGRADAAASGRGRPAPHGPASQEAQRARG
ncbi:sensor histidine kinase [Phytohabitans suffuscus]|uniref:histidine kinase n=1 Tax=Phytohabitans suffuscus TaxID=624315 RepID=A0A6F8YNS5_9ACTN|nr:histidine kinase [Phytohabitans suffuscus]BCB87528.1 two-component sensor histidine kinase [Phytohabitans suffuscus]